MQAASFNQKSDDALQEKLRRPELWNDVPLDYNRSWPYNKRLGFHVAIDAAARLPRSLPVAAVFSLSPPGQASWQDPPLKDLPVALTAICCSLLHAEAAALTLPC